jgi:DNA-binding XRE family transcriptional regulator
MKKIMTYKVVAEAKGRKGRTIPCSICGKPYTDNISPDAIEIVCALCTMGLADAESERVESLRLDPTEVLEAIKNKKLKQYRRSLNLAQDVFSKKIGFSRRQYLRIENNSYNPSTKTLERIERRLKNVTCA